MLVLTNHSTSTSIFISNSAAMARPIAHVLKLVTYPNAILRERCIPIAPEDIPGARVQSLVRNMLATVQLEEGLGLAAPQVSAQTLQPLSGSIHF
jgi:hypothetical protein